MVPKPGVLDSLPVGGTQRKPAAHGYTASAAIEMAVRTMRHAGIDIVQLADRPLLVSKAKMLELQVELGLPFGRKRLEMFVAGTRLVIEEEP